MQLLFFFLPTFPEHWARLGWAGLGLAGLGRAMLSSGSCWVLQSPAQPSPGAHCTPAFLPNGKFCCALSVTTAYFSAKHTVNSDSLSSLPFFPLLPPFSVFIFVFIFLLSFHSLVVALRPHTGGKCPDHLCSAFLILFSTRTLRRIGGSLGAPDHPNGDLQSQRSLPHSWADSLTAGLTPSH